MAIVADKTIVDTVNRQVADQANAIIFQFEGRQTTFAQFDRNSNKYISAYDQPLFFNIALTYALPRLHANRIVGSVTGGWTYAVSAQYASGMPLQVPNAQSALDSYLFQGPSFANRVPGQPLFTVDLNCHCCDPNRTFVLNPNAWVDPEPGKFGNSPAYYILQRLP